MMMMMFFLFLVHIGRLDEVYVHFMIAGHTKFSCDTMFGAIAKWLRGNILMNLSQIAHIMNRNNSKIKKKVMKRNIYLDFKKWFGQKATKVIGITKYHHFKFSKRNNKVILEVKRTNTENWREIPLQYDSSIANFSSIPKCDTIELSEGMKKGINSLKKYEPY